MPRWLIPLGIMVTMFIFFSPDYVGAQRKLQVELDSVISSRQAELDSIQNELEIKKEKLKNLEAEEKQYLNKLYAIEEQLSLNNQLITKIERQIVDLNRSLTKLESRLNANQEELKRRGEIMEQRLVWIYKRSNFSPLLYALSAKNFLEGARKLYIFSLLNRYDRNMIDQIKELSQQIENEKAELLRRKKEIIDLKVEEEAQAEIIKATHGKRKRLLKEIRTQKDVQLKGIQQLVEDQERISGIIEMLMAKKAASDIELAKAFLGLKGKLVWPVEGKIVRGFGKIKDEMYSTVISNPGIDIKANLGVSVYAAATGVVAYISWLRGYGSFIIIDHGGGYYSLYAHLDEILVETGELITAGEAIGSIGETGLEIDSESFSGPVLHFELRKGKEQLDPLPWLR